MAHRLLGDTLEILADLIAFPSVSQDSNLELIAYINQRLDQIGTRTYLTLDPTGTKANLFATLGPPELDGGIILSGHTDVVPVEGQDWSSDPYTATIRNRRLYGRGACDMKGFLACMMAFAPHYAEAGISRPLHLAFTYDEEVGCHGAKVMLRELQAVGRKPSLCIVGEPSMMGIIDGHKGCCEYTTNFTGLEGHGSMPDHGVNAVEYAARFVAKLLELADELKARGPRNGRFDPAHSTIQVGKMTGGIARNIIAGNASIDWELRPVTKEDYAFVHQQLDAFIYDELLPRMQAIHPEAGIDTEIVGDVGGLEPVESSKAVELVRDLTGNTDPTQCVSFNTEAGLFQDIGIDTVICGPGSIEQAHKPDEFVELDQLSACLEMIENLERHLK
ncbi:acetylornithine deacetylase [Pelagibacterium lentulum]|uniref:Acetylornithine deacetylase n=1 Tax=Pelagibacterium lentulum TaxID=2029865 RepID=A0A916RN65_9HYPH|nr:acetylornithine deacetylase [Pelagibacterium lentulum]GGA61469.1 acetylornithine deacetylase [Pelagibacterium lentulum]